MVSCICPTTASRNQYLPILLRSFLQQDHPDKELIVVSEDPIPLPDHPNIRLVKCEPNLTIGAKRNIACENARGSAIAHMDSDDYSAPGRLTEMLKLMKTSRKQVVGYDAITFYDPALNRAYRFGKGNGMWSCGTALVYTRAFWANHSFPPTRIGEDSAFIQQAREAKTLQAVNGWDKIIALDHPDNSWTRPAIPDKWLCDAEPVRKILFPVKLPKVLLALLSWNTHDISRDSCQALLQEKTRLEAAGYEAEVVVCDNGSTDGSQECWASLAGIHLIQNETNLGASIARNQIIDHALKGVADFVLFTDGDIEVVPWSVLGMAQWLETHPKAGCIGAYWEDYVPVREKATPFWTGPIEAVATRLIAPTQYGLFSRECFSKVRFDEKFGPGWSAEDNDFGWQMIHNHRLTPHYFKGMVYLHRRAHGSITHLAAAGYDPQALYEERLAYTRQKWAKIPEITNFLRGLRTYPKPEPEATI